MKIVTNTSLQGLNVSFKTPDGPQSFFLKPKGRIEVPDAWNSKVVENLVNRRMLSLKLMADPVAPVTQTHRPIKSTKKSK